MSDLVEIAESVLPEKQWITVLEGSLDWKLAAKSRLSEAFGVDVSSHSQHPRVIMLPGQIRAIDIIHILGRNDFTHRCVQGIDNRTLPYRPFFPDPILSLRSSYKEVDV